MTRHALVVPLILAALGAAAEAKDEPVLVGVLEHGFGWSAQWTRGEEYKDVRLAFKRTPAGWEPFPHEARDGDALRALVNGYPAVVTFTIGFDGRPLGTVTARRPDEYKSYGQVGLLPISSERVPSVGAPSGKSPFIRMGAEATFRPLVASSSKAVSDPDGWKRAPTPKIVRAGAVAALRAQLPTVETCDKADRVLPRRAYADDEVTTVESFTAKSGAWLVSLVIAPKRDSFCEYGDEDVADPLVHTFGVEPTGKVAFIGTALRLVDAGDYDGDGHSEVIFWRSEGDNNQGYVLVSDGFRSRTAFEWNYH
jgi:hypothetical protein